MLFDYNWKSQKKITSLKAFNTKFESLRDIKCVVGELWKGSKIETQIVGIEIHSHNNYER